jgi:ribosomal protein S18 acetylase RimI-like enzyme
MTVTIRPAKQAEAEDVRAISAAAYVPVYAPVIGTAPKPAIEDYGPRIARGEVWLLETGVGTVATLVLEPHENHLLIYSIAVLPEHQRRGHARRLLAFAEEQARRVGRSALQLYTNDRMEHNLALYRSCGFIETGRRPHPTRPGITLVDLAKSLIARETGHPAPE